MPQLNTRDDIKDYIIHLEQKYQVNKWQVNSIDIWPLLRIRLYFDLIFQVEKSYQQNTISNKNQNKQNANNNIILDNWRVKKLKSYLELKKFKHADILFAGAVTHRADYKGFSWNKLFDPIKKDISHKSIIVEHSPLNAYSDNIKLYNKKDVFFLYNIANYVYYDKNRSKRLQNVFNKINLDGYNDFLSELSKNKQTDNFAKAHSLENLEKLLRRFSDLVTMYEHILNRVNPKIVVSACYYTFQVFALNYIANKKGIKTIEIQHGPQSEVHLGYANFSNIPKNGFNIMPKYFWCWDNTSCNIINKWAKNKAFVGGNPWLQFFANSAENSGTNKNIILYSLQNLNIEYLFRDEVLQMIRETSNFMWWIRLHPKQNANKDEIIKKIKNKGIENVAIETPSSLPLPMVLANTSLHVTHFSGCTIEAQQFGIPTILIDKRGISTFPELIEHYAFFIESVEKFSPLATSLIKKFNSKTRNFSNIDYKKLFSQLMK